MATWSLGVITLKRLGFFLAECSPDISGTRALRVNMDAHFQDSNKNIKFKNVGKGEQAF